VSLIYELVGRVVVSALSWRYGKQIKIAGAVGVALVGIAGFLAATRQPPEG